MGVVEENGTGFVSISHGVGCMQRWVLEGGHWSVVGRWSLPLDRDRSREEGAAGSWDGRGHEMVDHGVWVHTDGEASAVCMCAVVVVQSPRDALLDCPPLPSPLPPSPTRFHLKSVPAKKSSPSFTPNQPPPYTHPTPIHCKCRTPYSPSHHSAPPHPSAHATVSARVGGLGLRDSIDADKGVGGHTHHTP